METMEKGHSYFRIPSMLWAIALAGILWRIVSFLFCKDLWLDEATLCIGILHRGFYGLCSPLDYGQVAPIGFLWAVKASVLLLGNHDFAFRLPSLVAAIAAVLLFRRLVVDLFPDGSTSALFAMAAFAINPALYSYTCQAKQYGFDAFATVAILLCAIRVLKAGSPSDLLLFGAVAALSSCFSFTSPFVFGPAGLVLLMGGVRRRNWSQCVRILLSTGGASLSFLLHYWFFARHATGDMQQLWQQQRLLLPVAIPELERNLSLLAQSMIDPLGFHWALLGGVFLFAIPGLKKLQHGLPQLELICLLFGSGLLGGIASLAFGYPWQGRFLLYLVPVGCLLLGASLQFLKSCLPEYSFRWAVLALIPLLFGHSLLKLTARTLHPISGQGFTDVMQRVAAKSEPGAPLHIDADSAAVFAFYDLRFSYHHHFQVLGGGLSIGDNSRGLNGFGSSGIGPGVGGVCWIVFPDHFIGGLQHRNATLAALENLGGKRIDSVELFFSSAYRYRF